MEWRTRVERERRKGTGTGSKGKGIRRHRVVSWPRRWKGEAAGDHTDPSHNSTTPTTLVRTPSPRQKPRPFDPFGTASFQPCAFHRGYPCTRHPTRLSAFHALIPHLSQLSPFSHPHSTVSTFLSMALTTLEISRVRKRSDSCALGWTLCSSLERRIPADTKSGVVDADFRSAFGVFPLS